MTIVIMQCPRGQELNLAVNTKEAKLIGYCQSCGRLYEIVKPDIDPEEAADMERRAQPLKRDKGAEALFYLRCTGILQ